LVDLLGKKKLEEEIDRLRSRVGDLEEEKGSLQLQIERRDDKIRKLTSASQETSLALKAAEQRIAALQARGAGEGEGEGAREREETATEGGGQSQGSSPPRALKPRELERLLERLDAVRSPQGDLLSAYAARGSALVGLSPEVADLVKRAGPDRGVAVFSDPFLFTIALVPPFPIKKDEMTVAGSFKTEPLRRSSTPRSWWWRPMPARPFWGWPWVGRGSRSTPSSGAPSRRSTPRAAGARRGLSG